MRLQKLVVAMAMTVALSSGWANALGLGEVTLHSALNQPLDAEIELLQLRDLTRNEVLPNLASRSDFQRAGVERPFSLSGINFKTKIRENGTGYIHITSRDAVREPFLNFLMEIHWPSGRLLREYTLLLDPPAFSDQPVAPVKPAMTQPYGARPPKQQPNPFEERQLQTIPDYLPSPAEAYQLGIQAVPTQPINSHPDQTSFRSEKQVSEPSAAASPVVQSPVVQSYEVQPNDNLWSIARAVRPSGELTVQQTMVAIQRSNPKAFMRENINELKKGEVLRIPSQSEIESISYQDSVADVARQNREWQARLEQLDASRRSKAETGGSGLPSDGKLSIVGTDNASGEGQDLGGSDGAGNTELRNELSMTRETMDELGRENDELKSRMQDLDEQIETLKRLITLKDDQMAALQTSSDEPETQLTKVDEPKVEGKPAIPPAKEEPAEEQGFFSFIMSSPLYMILAALIPIGLIAAFIIYRRRQEELWDEDEDEVEIEESDIDSLPTMDDLVVEGDDEFDLELDDTFTIDEEALIDEEEPEEIVQQTQDVLSEADIYIAYGRFPQAAELLGKSIVAEPERTDLHLKLLEVHAEANDLDSFREALDALEALGDARANRQADVFKARFPEDAFVDRGDSSVETELANVELNDVFANEPEVDEGIAFEVSVDDVSEESVEQVEEPGDDLDFELSDDEDDDSNGLPDLDLDDVELPEVPGDSVSKGTDETEGADDFGDFDLDLDDDTASGEKTITDSMSDFEAALDDDDDDDDLDFLSDENEVSTKLDLARAYLDMGDKEGAKEILQEVLESGSAEQKEEAQGLIVTMGG